MAVQRVIQESVDINRDRLAGMHMHQLRLPEIGDDTDIVWDRRKQRVTRLHEAALLHASTGDRPG